MTDIVKHPYKELQEQPLEFEETIRPEQFTEEDFSFKAPQFIQPDKEKIFNEKFAELNQRTVLIDRKEAEALYDYILTEIDTNDDNFISEEEAKSEAAQKLAHLTQYPVKGTGQTSKSTIGFYNPTRGEVTVPDNDPCKTWPYIQGVKTFKGAQLFSDAQHITQKSLNSLRQILDSYTRRSPAKKHCIEFGPVPMPGDPENMVSHYPDLKLKITLDSETNTVEFEEVNGPRANMFLGAGLLTIEGELKKANKIAPIEKGLKKLFDNLEEYEILPEDIINIPPQKLPNEVIDPSDITDK